jgi:hypothetical protein
MMQNPVETHDPGETMPVRFMAAAVVLALTPAIPEAQQRVEQLLRPGSRVEYVLPQSSTPFRGTLQQVDSGTLVVRPDGIDMLLPLGLDTLRSLKVASGRRNRAHAALRGAGRGFRTGAVIGLVVTGLVVLMEGDSCDGCTLSGGVTAAMLSVVGTIGLGVVGGVAGAISPGENWHDVPLPARGSPPDIVR